MTTRILKWKVPLDDDFHSIKGQFLHAEPMSPEEVESGSWRHLRGETDAYFVWIWTRVQDGEASTGFDDLTSGTWDYRASRLYRVYGTGQPVDDDMNFCATVKQDRFMWHVLSKIDESVLDDTTRGDLAQSEH